VTVPQRRPVNRVTSTRRPKTAGEPPHVRRTRPPIASAAEDPATPDARLLHAPEDGEADGASETLVQKARIGGRSVLIAAWGKAQAASARVRAVSPIGQFGGLVVAALLLSAFAVIAALRPGATPANRAYVDNAETERVVAAARNALTVLYGYDGADMGGYAVAVHRVLTGPMAAQFDKTGQVSITAIEQTKLKTDVQVDPIGVTDLQGDHAELLLYLAVSGSKGGQAQQSASGPLVVRMTEVDGRWLASDIVDRN
jgi:Mce-associated membrane protein